MIKFKGAHSAHSQSLSDKSVKAKVKKTEPTKGEVNVDKIIPKETIKVPDRPHWTMPKFLNHLAHGKTIDVNTPEYVFKMVRVAGGYIYIHENGICFVSIDELGTD
ncbi:MAG: hypothetical protein GY804_01135 [Alphaproteobacteria bacterium]|nr:hypothetical protein [Alphaproteobacteria bacterium]